MYALFAALVSKTEKCYRTCVANGGYGPRDGTDIYPLGRLQRIRVPATSGPTKVVTARHEVELITIWRDPFVCVEALTGGAGSVRLAKT